MFLRPHHFQAADRHWSELVTISQNWDSHYNYGVRQIEISPEALANFQVQVSSCKVRMRDGLIVSLLPGQEPDRINLKKVLEEKSEVMVYLGVPKLALGRVNVGETSNGEAHRFVESTLFVPDESVGGNEQEIQFRHANACLLLEEKPGYEILPIARIKRVGNEEALPVLDDDYFPPCVAVDAWPPLALGVIRVIYDKIGNHVETISQRVAQRGINLTSQTPGDLEDLLRLMILNQASAILHCHTFAKGVHPFLAYRELCRIVGMLSIFRTDRKVPDDIPPYDHDDLARIFRWIELEIDGRLGKGDEKPTNYEQRPFIGAGNGMQTSLEQEWLHRGWSWYIGVRGSNISEAEIRVALQPGKLDWKLGTAQRVDLIFRAGFPGVEMQDLANAPRMLPANQGWIYYEVFKDTENASWRDVIAEQTLALRFTTELIGNLQSLPGKKELEVVLPDKRVTLEFALFAVPTG